jgi:aryl-alcohol dehydrogenase-like predicted oxidoreductase
MNKRLALGTAQFGLPYGIANMSGQVNQVEVEAILTEAWEAGVDTLDTAIAYGNSEERLGAIGVDQWKLVSKLPEIPENCKDVTGWVENMVTGSLARLKIPRLYGLLLHRPEQLLSSQGEALYAALKKLQDQKLVQKIGISIYGPSELDKIGSTYQFDLVQAPLNVLDRRMIDSGWLLRLSNAKTEIHTRSVFLQGLLLMDSEKRPKEFDKWKTSLDRWDRWLIDQEIEPVQACLASIFAQPEVDRIVIGTDSLEHLQGILANTGGLVELPPKFLMTEDLDLINPSRWSSFL